MKEPYPTNKLQPNFIVGNLSTDLVEMTLDLCTRHENHNPRFPKMMYESYVNHMIQLSLDIHRNISDANSLKIHKSKRRTLQELACGDCSSFEKLIFISFKKGWISKKQHMKWQSLICDLHFRIKKWID